MTDPLIRNIDEVEFRPMEMAGAERITMSMMVGREHGAPNFSMRQFRIAPGGHSPRHSHDYEHEVLVLDGEGDVLLAGERRHIKAGDTLFVPPEQEHQFRTPEGGPGLRFICLVPASRNCGDPTPGS
ncbi:MAG: cupin domain-containing protein [Phycisphaerales bacterium]